MPKSINQHGLYRLKIELKNFIKQLFFLQSKPTRNSELIYDIYHKIREEKLQKLNNFKTPEDYFSDITFLTTDGKLRYSLLNNKIVFGKANFINFKIIEIIEGIMNDSNPSNVIELGSGGGKNLLWFASRYKNINFIGLELSPISVDLARAAAKKYNIKNINFQVCDLTKIETYEHLLTETTFVYSHHTLEEMPRIYKLPLRALKNSSVKLIALLEPVYMFKFSRLFLDISKRLRIKNRDRLIGLKRFCKKNLSKVFYIEIVDLGLAVKPENSTTLVILKRK
tara:strand:+ start:4102 stop:4947 length:846 start_codon:yes stop_codon:yes gene_type:complete